MKSLKELIFRLEVLQTYGSKEQSVNSICFDSRKVNPGDLFVATRGTHVDGHDFIEKAINSGACVIVCEELPNSMDDSVTYLQVTNAANALGKLASAFYGYPSERLRLVAVTGTNGKTTTATLLYELFRKLGYKVGLLSTVNNKIEVEVIPATHTTPDAVQLNALLKQMVERGCTHCFMEASSHAIHQQRIAGLAFEGAIFTNITHDHLDYHKTFDEYIKAKKLLFDALSKESFALINTDDKRGPVMTQNTSAKRHTYGLKQMSDFKAKVVSNTFQGLELDLDNKSVWFKLVGDFNAYNLLATYGAAVLLGEEKDEVLIQLSDILPVEGRFELLNSQKATGIVDYAHTPDALENVLQTINNVRTGNENLITVVGCGGERDKEKRPEMAKVACQWSDRVIFTSDNPRSEEPEVIIKDMQEGVSPTDFKKTLSIVDRKEAIKVACALSRPNDIILVAGKGHETYQEFKGVRLNFDDRKVLNEFLEIIE
ncbi:UDP-N-acetylmuramoyl-L-alanyl-D-glutamate--2,6-diaminopimelate ligase [Xanthovirga aplysinae]|uniref:UDP-N-acetylmuramoyl-L-alanyl-D-glutamate--2, 6-diaminopimelate ligase n=1 Tax=Xanthovirga aplysinae TaxID=2529853 RepID=UPI0012BC589E|nr:UDP-N-acetylmuramoyl-L-alanyl-D-glutamate--2,6-diaminopimelate ligase [Xanthovirga aplysinae]MTI32862.1 UDP-N-acetylmuramoyl-L-alanyl-D-glutamate--2,6-diaminopimelate ligase [Xanthovirga aplysinae]